MVSNPGFESKEMAITLGSTEVPAPLRIALAVGQICDGDADAGCEVGGLGNCVGTWIWRNELELAG